MAKHNADTRLWEADSVIALLGRIDPDKLPVEEERALGECQAQAVDEWLAAYLDLSRPTTPREPLLKRRRTHA